MLLLRGFFARFALLDRATFLERVRHPFLCFDAPPVGDGDGDGSFATAPLTEAVRTALFEADLRCLAPVASRFGAAPGSVITLGRAGNTDVVVADGRVSKFHAYLQEGPDGWTVTDAGSLNGTWVDGERLEPYRPHPLRPGAQVALAGAVTSFFATPAHLYDLFLLEATAGGDLCDGRLAPATSEDATLSLPDLWNRGATR